MNSILIFEQDFISPTQIELTDEFRLKHINTVLKAKKGDILRLALLGKGITHISITTIDNNKITFDLNQEITQISHPNYHLYVGLSRPPTCKKILEHGTCFGVQSFNFFKAELSEKSYLTSKLFEAGLYRDSINLGLSQSGQYYQKPSFTLSKSFADTFLKDGQNFFLSLNQKNNFSDYNIDFSTPINIFIGPERGWTKSEEKKLCARGVSPVSIGSSIFRVEIAAFSALAQLELLRNKKN